MKLSPIALVLTGLALVTAGALGTAQIERLDLAQMVAKTDNAVFGTISAKEVVRIDSPADGPTLYFTGLTVSGTSLKTGQPTEATMWFPGGFVSATEGVHNSEAPSADDQKVGNQVVVFYKWQENLGGDFQGNGLYASHGGLYRTFESRNGTTIVQGRGEGYAIPTNVSLTDLDTQIN
jgi:hypothetical protein